jgi:hypothetical protein
VEPAGRVRRAARGARRPPAPYADTGRATLDLAYRCRVTGGEVRLSDESGEAGWFALDALPELAFEGERLAAAALRRERA